MARFGIAGISQTTSPNGIRLRMPLEDTAVIDMITKRNTDGCYGLIITDAGITTDPVTRLQLLQRKLATYRHAIINDLLADTCPATTPEHFYIQVVCDLCPTPEMQRISSVLTDDQPPIEIPLLFSELSAGSWGVTSPTEPASNELSEDMQEAVKAAFATAAQWLAEDEIPLFIYWLEGDDQKLAAITGAKNQEEVIARVTAWASKMGNEAWLCVLISAAKTGEGILPADLLIAHCCERGNAAGFVLVQEIGLNAKNGNLELRGDINYAESCPNFFPTD
jgi:hypothetical protein